MPFWNIFLIILLAIFILFSIFFFIFSFLNIFSLLFGAPFVKSKKNARKEMLKVARIQKGDIIFDLGSGDGTLLIEAVKNYNFKKAYGIEINPILVLISKIKIIFKGLQNKIEIKQGDFLKEDLNKATIILVYLWPKVQRKLEKKFKKELKPGTQIVSNAFPFQNLPLKKEIRLSNRFFIRRYII